MDGNLFDKVEKIMDKVDKLRNCPPYRGRPLMDEIEEDILALFPEEILVWEKLKQSNEKTEAKRIKEEHIRIIRDWMSGFE